MFESFYHRKITQAGVKLTNQETLERCAANALSLLETEGSCVCIYDTSLLYPENTTPIWIIHYQKPIKTHQDTTGESVDYLQRLGLSTGGYWRECDLGDDNRVYSLDSKEELFNRYLDSECLDGIDSINDYTWDGLCFAYYGGKPV